MRKHIVQSEEWGQFKSSFGTEAIRVGNTQYTLHRIPKTKIAYAYCPKANPFEIDFKKIEESARNNNCFAIKFDVPNVLANTSEGRKAEQLFEELPNTPKAKKPTFTKYNILLDLKPTEEELLMGMHQKQRYNIKYSQRNGVSAKIESGDKAFEVFWKLQEETAQRQGFLIHPKRYYQNLYNQLHEKNIADIMIARHENEPLTAWMLFKYDGVLYYPYGASSNAKQKLQASSLVGWETIKYGKRNSCELFDMWGSCKDLNDRTDPEWGFSNFKIKFGGEHVEYIDSYDLVINKTVYEIFNFAYPKAIALLKKIK